MSKAPPAEHLMTSVGGHVTWQFGQYEDVGS